MTAQASIPLKWYVPFANNDSSRVELPVTTSDPTRASQSLGFPPLTMQPPESGGVPPQGEDFNGGMNQVARICWWLLNGGGYPYDSVFASNSNINGYPNGATLQSADFLGQWISIADNNQNNPDVSGASWVPGFQYGITALTGLTGGTVTPTPAQAAKRAITLAGALTSALTIILPTWLKDWTITNGTSGAFVVIVKTAAGSGVTIPQNSQPTRVSGDGTNITQSAENIAPATQPTNAVPMSQATGVVGNVRNLTMDIAAVSATATLTADEIIVETALGGARYCLANFNKTINLATTGAGGMDTGAAPVSGYVAVYAIWNPATQTAALLATNATGAPAANVYGGANMPVGYTASALVSVWGTTAASLFRAGHQRDRAVNFPGITVFSAASIVTGGSTGLAAAVPPNTKSVGGVLALSSTVASNMLISVGSDANISGQANVSNPSAAAAVPLYGSFSGLLITTQQVIFLTTQSNAGTPTFTIIISSYTF